MDSTGARTGDFARVLSPSLPGTAGLCSTISFYYHMYGTDIGTLNLYIVHDPPPLQFDLPIWSVNGNRGDQWNLAEINVTFPVNIKVSFPSDKSRANLDLATYKVCCCFKEHADFSTAPTVPVFCRW